jgi:hypothetical protein
LTRRSAARRLPDSLVAPELADPVGSLEVGQHEDVEQLGAGSWAEGVERLPPAAQRERVNVYFAT